MKKPLYHTMVISDLTAEVLRLDKETSYQWLLDFIADLNQNEPRKCKTSYAKNLISSTNKRRGKSSESGKKGVAKRWPKKEPKNKDLGTPPVDDLDTSSKGKGKETKHKYGEYKHVLLTDKQYASLEKKFNSTLSEKIKELDEGIETYGYKYQNHSLVIQRWASKKGKENAPTNTDAYGRTPNC